MSEEVNAVLGAVEKVALKILDQLPYHLHKTYTIDVDKIRSLEDVKDVLRLLDITITATTKERQEELERFHHVLVEQARGAE